MLLRPGPAALLLSALALTTAYTPGFRLSSCVPTASLRSHRKRALLRANLPDGIEPLEGLSSLLREADIVEPETVVELSAGFCNWVYRVDLPEQADASACSMLGKVFSPLAKMRIAAPDRGRGDELAGEAGLGPRVRFRSEDGLITEFVPGSDLSERDIHARTPWLLRRIASKLAGLHSLALPHPAADGDGTGSAADATAKPPVVLWEFLNSMLAQVAERPQTMPEGMCLQEVADEVARMRTRFDKLGLPVVFGHGEMPSPCPTPLHRVAPRLRVHCVCTACALPVHCLCRRSQAEQRDDAQPARSRDRSEAEHWRVLHRLRAGRCALPRVNATRPRPCRRHRVEPPHGVFRPQVSSYYYAWPRLDPRALARQRQVRPLQPSP
jgi:hypothetical protein